MALKMFYAYIGIFLAGSVAMAAAVKQLASGFAASGKKPYVYGVVSSMVASGTAYLSTLLSDHLFGVYWFLAGIYFLFGVIHMAMVHKKYFGQGGEQSTKAIIGEILFGLAIICFTVVVFSALLYFISDKKSFLFYPLLMSTVTFFIPFLFLKTFDAAYSIPPPVYKTWEYPVDEEIEPPAEKDGEKVLVIGLEVAKKSTDAHKTYFRAKAPEAMTLGELYYHFINDYNEAQSETPISFTNDKYEPYQWLFRRKPKWFQRARILDPGINFRENKVKENTVIICERISKQLQS